MNVSETSPIVQPRHLVLIGLMGSGKSTVGALLASVASVEFVDLDAVVESVAGMAIAQIFEEQGEPGFRVLEGEALLRELDREVPVVLATGGGTPLSVTNRLQLRASGYVVWLRAEVPTLVSRIGDDPSRPLLAGDAAGTLASQRTERLAAYASASHQVIDVDGLTPDEVVERILASADLVWLPPTGRGSNATSEG